MPEAGGGAGREAAMRADASGSSRAPEIGWRQRLSWWLRDHWGIRAALLAVLLGFGGVLLFDLNRNRLTPMHPHEVPALAGTVNRLEAGLGFRTEDAASHYHNSHLPSALVVTEVAPGGAMAEAGLREGDLIVSPYLDCLYKSLVLGQGGTVAVRAQRGTERLALQVQVPDLGLPTRGVRWACPDSIVPGDGRPGVPAKPPGWQ